MTVQELMHILNGFDPMAEIAGTFENVINPIEIYPAADGRVLIDCDNGDYKLRHQKIKCVVCGVQAVDTPHGGSPVCYNHYGYFKPRQKKTNI